MFKKFALIGVLCLGLAGISGVDANAYPISLGGWTFTKASVDATTIWTGVGNFDLKASYVSVTLSDIQLKLYSINPGGNTGGVGVPFSLTSPVTGTDVLDPVAKNGKYTSLIVFHDSDFTSLIDPALLALALPNPNWTLDPNHVDVVHFKAVIVGYSDVDSRCDNYYYNSYPQPTTIDYTCYPFSFADPDPLKWTAYAEEVAHLEVACDLQNGAYVCSQLTPLWEWSKKSPVYIAP